MSDSPDHMSGTRGGGVQLLFVLWLLALHLAVFVGTAGLDFPLVKDESHFWETTRSFAEDFPPSLEQLRDYPEVITPLCFVAWGWVEHVFGGGVVPLRTLNLALAFLLACMVGVRLRGADPEAMLAAVGLILYPYYVGLAAHLYTDLPAAFLTFLAFWLHGRGHRVSSALLFVLAIATRQYMIAFPLALAAAEGTAVLRGERERWKEAVGPLLAASSLGLWVLFFGGLGPEAGRELWLTRYPAPMLDVTDFIVEYGLYFLVGIGVYFVLPEFVLYRRWREPGWRAPLRWIGARHLAIAALLLAVFWLYPPVFPDRAMGFFDRAVRLVLGSGWERLALYYLLALAACLRFARLDVGFWVVAANLGLIMKAQLSWDKYLLPTLVVLWYLRSRRVLTGERAFPRRGEDAPLG